jgi:hypothetical protein
MKRAAASLALAAALLFAASTVTFTAPAAAANQYDVDGNCQVNIIDLMIVAKRFGAEWGSLLYTPAYDFDSDGDIDIFDLQRLASHMGEHC